jgi:spectinomycin phosphotransferase
MLEKSDLNNVALIACLHQEFSLQDPRIEFLPLGADQHTAVYRAETANKKAYFVKLRGGHFNETSVTLPSYLSKRGSHQIIAPLATKSGRLWANLLDFKVILYPYVEGRDGYEIDLSDQDWIELGQAAKYIHSTALPAAMAGNIKQETFSPLARETIRSILARVEHDVFPDPVGVKLAAFLQRKRGEILDLVNRAERHARTLQKSPPDNVLCHSDLHAGNILIDGSGALYIVDWDDPIYAPKERDLMFAGGGQGFRGHTPGEEEVLFHQGYGPANINQTALAYYRYERIIEDIAAFYEQITSSDKSDADREQSFRYLTSNFVPGNTIEIAYHSDKTLASG